MSRIAAIAHTLKLEAGWYAGNEARDTNPTLDGITQTTYDDDRDARKVPRQSVRLMTAEERTAIYTRYFVDARCYMLPEPVDAIQHAFAFTSGAKTAIKVLQRTLGVEDDGVVGPRTVDALRPWNATELGAALLFGQTAWYTDLAVDKPVKRPNLPSWNRRIIAGSRLLCLRPALPPTKSPAALAA